MELFCKHTGLAEVENRYITKVKSQKLFICTPSARAWLNQSHVNASILNPIKLPMLVTPKRYNNSVWGGGYNGRNEERWPD